MKEYRIDCIQMTDRASAHEYLAKVFSFPEWYGKNLDALFDLMCDMGESAVIIENADALSSLGGYGEALLSTIKDAAKENPNMNFLKIDDLKA